MIFSETREIKDQSHNFYSREMRIKFAFSLEVIRPSESSIYVLSFFGSASSLALPKLLLKHFDAFNLTWLIFKMSDLTSHRQTFWSAYTCMWFIMFFGRSDFFVAIIRVSSRHDDSWGCNDCTFEKKTAVFKGLYCDPKPILCHCKIGGKLFCICPQENLFSCLTSLSEWPTGILI